MNTSRTHLISTEAVLIRTELLSFHNQLRLHMSRYLTISAALSIGLMGLLLGNANPLHADEPNPVTAIDILLEPDATMIAKATPLTGRRASALSANDPWDAGFSIILR